MAMQQNQNYCFVLILVAHVILMNVSITCGLYKEERFPIEYKQHCNNWDPFIHKCTKCSTVFKNDDAVTTKQVAIECKDNEYVEIIPQNITYSVNTKWNSKEMHESCNEYYRSRLADCIKENETCRSHPDCIKIGKSYECQADHNDIKKCNLKEDSTQDWINQCRNKSVCTVDAPLKVDCPRLLVMCDVAENSKCRIIKVVIEYKCVPIRVNPPEEPNNELILIILISVAAPLTVIAVFSTMVILYCRKKNKRPRKNGQSDADAELPLNNIHTNSNGHHNRDRTDSESQGGNRDNHQTEIGDNNNDSNGGSGGSRDRIDSANEPTYEDFMARKKSFNNPNWKCKVVTTVDLVHAGLYYTGTDDKCQCFSCKRTIYDWQKGDKADVEHFKTSPGCQYIKEHFKSENNRRKTFQNWPENAKVSAENLYKNGFIYIGPNDKVQCVYCNGKISNWEEGDEVEVEHNRCFPTCKGPLAKPQN